MDTDWAPVLSTHYFTEWKLKAFFAQKPPVGAGDPAVFTRRRLQAIKLSKRVTRRSENCYAKWRKANSYRPTLSFGVEDPHGDSEH
jgi:hypothetical protein